MTTVLNAHAGVERKKGSGRDLLRLARMAGKDIPLQPGEMQ